MTSIAYRIMLATVLGIGLSVIAQPAAAQSTAPTASDVVIRATPAGAPVAAAYLTITAGTQGADRLIAVKIDPAIAGAVEIHDTIDDNGIMRMRRIDGVEIKPGTPAQMKPGGRHVMMMDLKRPLAAGDTVRLVLVFEKAGEVPVDAKVQDIRPAGAMGGHGAGHGMDHHAH